MKREYFVILIFGLTVLSSDVEARVTRIQLTSRELLVNGVVFDRSGPYEKLQGRVFFEVDPADPRALLVALDNWVRFGIEPPPSRFPQLADGTLVPPDRQSTGFPQVQFGPVSFKSVPLTPLKKVIVGEEDLQ